MAEPSPSFPRKVPVSTEPCHFGECRAVRPAGADEIQKLLAAAVRSRGAADRAASAMAGGGGSLSRRSIFAWRLQGGAPTYVMLGRFANGGREADFLLLTPEMSDALGPGRCTILHLLTGHTLEGLPEILSEVQLAEHLARQGEGPWGASAVQASIMDLRTLRLEAETPLDFARLRAEEQAERALRQLGVSGKRRPGPRRCRRRVAARVNQRPRARPDGQSNSASSLPEDSLEGTDWDAMRESSEGDNEEEALQVEVARPSAERMDEHVRRGWADRQRQVDRYTSAAVLDDFGARLGRILVNEHLSAQSLDAHCGRCSARVNRRYLPRKGPAGPSGARQAQGRPVGALVAWLRQPCQGDACAHRAAWSSDVLTLQRREAARAWAEGQDCFSPLLQRERPRGPEEPPEPRGLV